MADDAPDDPTPDDPAADDPRLGPLREAVSSLIEASRLDVTHKDFARTPARVANLWLEHFLAGYSRDPADILGDPVEGEAPTELVVLRDLPFHGMCPHHLLPYIGKATVAYLPGKQLLGFGRVGQLVECFTRRLTLQERACSDVVDALMNHIDARGAGCVMVGEHACLRIPERRHDAQVVTAAFRGELQRRAELQDRLMP